MHLVGYLYEDYHDAQSLEHKVFLTLVCHNKHGLFERFNCVGFP
jgi:hypothetical protein